MANATTMTYGAYSFSPVPFITLRKEWNSAEDRTHVGATFNCTLEGTITPLPNPGGLDEVDRLQDEMRSGLAPDGEEFLVKCGSYIVIKSYPTILNLEFTPSNDNWVFTTPYTIEMEWHEDNYDEDSMSGVDLIPPYIKSVNEEWSIEGVDDKAYYTWSPNGVLDVSPFVFRITHNVSAVGKRVYYGGSGQLRDNKEAWEWAEDWVKARLGWEPTDSDDTNEVTGPKMLGDHGVINLNTSDFGPYNHIRTKTINEDTGEFSVTESWIAINPDSSTGIAGAATEDFTATVRTSIQNDLTTVTVEGTITGFEERAYGTGVGDFAINTPKYNNAIDYWTNVQTKLYHRAIHVSSGVSTRTLNITPNTTSIGHSPPNGTVSYAYEYNDRPCNFVTGALSEVITINDTYPHDVFAPLVVLGRARGPILQSIDTPTSSQRNVSIEVVMPPHTGCADITAARAAAPLNEVECILKDLEDELTAAYDQVFKAGDTSQWSPKTGRYSRNVTWEFVNCSGSAPSTSMSCT